MELPGGAEEGNAAGGSGESGPRLEKIVLGHGVVLRHWAHLPTQPAVSFHQRGDDLFNPALERSRDQQFGVGGEDESRWLLLKK